MDIGSHIYGRAHADEFTKEAWALELRTYRRTASVSDDDLRSFTLGVIRSLVREADSLERVRAALDALDEVTYGI